MLLFSGDSDSSCGRVNCPPNHQSIAMTLRSGFTGTGFISQPPLQGRWEHMTNPHQIATSMRNNCSCAELANFGVLNYCSSYSEPNNRPQNITMPINSFWNSIHKHCFLRMPWTGNLNSVSFRSCNIAFEVLHMQQDLLLSWIHHQSDSDDFPAGGRSLKYLFTSLDKHHWFSLPSSTGRYPFAFLSSSLSFSCHLLLLQFSTSVVLNLSKATTL